MFMMNICFLLYFGTEMKLFFIVPLIILTIIMNLSILNAYWLFTFYNDTKSSDSEIVVNKIYEYLIGVNGISVWLGRCLRGSLILIGIMSSQDVLTLISIAYSIIFEINLILMVKIVNKHGTHDQFFQESIY